MKKTSFSTAPPLSATAQSDYSMMKTSVDARGAPAGAKSDILDQGLAAGK